MHIPPCLYLIIEVGRFRVVGLDNHRFLAAVIKPIFHCEPFSLPVGKVLVKVEMYQILFSQVLPNCAFDFTSLYGDGG
jgi:hypothetical protein